MGCLFEFRERGMYMDIRVRRLIIAVLAVSLSGCAYVKTPVVKDSPEQAVHYNEEIPAVEESFTPVFEKSDIPNEVKDKMYGVTISDSSRVGFDGLSYLTLSYIGYDGENHTGNMIVDKNLADEVVCIFKELYEAKFPIEKIRLACEYGGVDELSMEDNNTSAFNDRPVTGGSGLSYHQLGRAIDINPLVNPYIKGSVVLPASAQWYTDRTSEAVGIITSDSDCVKIFKKYGWTWGGDWRSLKDYQHFEKR